jgi:hypothetical protein
MLVDIQGCGVKFYDPEIASSELVEDGEVLFCAGNLSNTAIDNFPASTVRKHNVLNWLWFG